MITIGLIVSHCTEMDIIIITTCGEEHQSECKVILPQHSRVLLIQFTVYIIVHEYKTNGIIKTVK